ncbi:hypothetical protein HDU98_003212 [Podochytrium sp. JEL0797]|nr:hypothetical protein HDU98_003212 [Podochytrium sp. JEL0797]
MACHYLGVSVSCGLTCAMASLVHTRKKALQVPYPTNSIYFCAVYSGLCTIAYLYPAVLCASKRLTRWHERALDSIGVTQPIRFWIWFLGVNATAFGAWCVISAMFWDPTFVCWDQLGEAPEWNPYLPSECDQLTNIWFYGIFIVFAIFGNLYIVVDEQIQIVLGKTGTFVEMHTLESPTSSMSIPPIPSRGGARSSRGVPQKQTSLSPQQDIRFYMGE